MPARNSKELKGLYEYMRIFGELDRLSRNGISFVYAKRRDERKQSYLIPPSNDLKYQEGHLQRILSKRIDKIPTDRSTLNNLETLGVLLEESISSNPFADGIANKVENLGHALFAQAKIYSNSEYFAKANDYILQALFEYAHLLKLRPNKEKEIKDIIESNLSVILGKKLETKVGSEFGVAPTNTSSLHNKYANQ